MGRPRLQLQNKIFGRLTVKEFLGVNNSKHTLWRCACICGNSKVVTGGNLTNGSTQSCGCYDLEDRASRQTKHDLYGTKEHQTWTGMIQRCTNCKNPRYARYGGRGISVCLEWRQSFETFYIDMGQAPTNLHSLDRIDNNGNYCKENCRWATKKEQSNNTCTVIKITFEGRTKTITQWAEHLNIPVAWLYKKLRMQHLNLGEAIQTWKNKYANDCL